MIDTCSIGCCAKNFFNIGLLITLMATITGMISGVGIFIIIWVLRRSKKEGVAEDNQ